MTRFSDMWKAGANDLMEDMFGITVTYTPAGRSGSSITARWYPDESIPEYLDDGEQLKSIGRLVVNPDDVSTPTESDTVTINGVVWAVVQFAKRAHCYEMQLVRRQQRRHEGGTSRISR